MEIIWKIINAKRYDDTGIIFEVTYSCLLHNNGILQSQEGGDVTLSAPVDEIIPYESITETILLEWTKEKLGIETVSIIEADLIAFNDKLIKHREAMNNIKNGLPYETK